MEKGKPQREIKLLDNHIYGGYEKDVFVCLELAEIVSPLLKKYGLRKSGLK